MKSQNYATIDAHIISCRLHHDNNASYSVGLKSAKEHQAQTNFKAAENLVINMDTHLTLQVDKHAKQQTNQFTLIVNVLTANKERKTVGTTFANFKKEGLQTYQVSECSCKDKAFQVDILFTSKIHEVKNSNSKNQKKEITKPSKDQFLSLQGTPRQSRDLKAQLQSKKPKQLQKPISPKKQPKLPQVKSEKNIGIQKPLSSNSKQSKDNQQILKPQLAVLYQKIKLYELELQSLRPLKKQLLLQKLNNERLQQLLEIEQQKNQIALSHIETLQDTIQIILEKINLQSGKEPPTNFKIIQQEEEFLIINQELQTELEKERKKSEFLSLQIIKLKIEVEELSKRLSEFQIKEDIQKNAELLQAPKEKQHDSLIDTPNEIMITSRCKPSQKQQDEDKINQKSQTRPIQNQGQSRRDTQMVHITMNPLQKQRTKNNVDKRKNPPNVPKKSPIRNSGALKNTKNMGKDKNLRNTEISGQKKSNLGSQSSLDVKNQKKFHQSQASSTLHKTKNSTQIQTKTDGAESMRKSLSSGINEAKSEDVGKILNKVDYGVRSNNGQIVEFQQ